MEKRFHLKRVTELPENPDPHAVYILMPKQFSQTFYDERTSRNIGWITKNEQRMLQTKTTVAVFGQGGMGGLIAATYVRLGIGTVIIVEPPKEAFDVSNINRQFAATRSSVGKSKAFESARMIREIADDTTLIVCPHEIIETNAEAFMDLLKGCDLIFDEIEFWALGSRLALHSIAAKMGITIYNCNTVGHRTYLWNFAPKSMLLSECIPMQISDAWALQKRIQKGIAGKHEIRHVMNEVMKIFLPEIPEYSANVKKFSTVKNWHERLEKKQQAIVISPNPIMASGFAANHGLFHILRKRSRVKRKFATVPEMPGYVMYDAALHVSRTVKKKWW